jgi:hypothetical protein
MIASDIAEGGLPLLALDACWAIDHHPSDRAEALEAVAAHLTLETAHKAITTARATEANWRAPALAALALVLPESEQGGVLLEAFEAVALINSEWDRIWAAVSVAPLLLSLAWTSALAEPDLAYVPAQPRSPPLGCRPAHGPVPHVQDVVRARLHRPRSARAGACQRDGQSHGRLGLAATHRGHALGPQLRHLLLHDRDRVYGRDFRQRAGRVSIDAIATPIHAPRANAIVQRVIGTLRRECLDHIIVLDEQHLSSVLRESVHYYNTERPHRTLGLQTPELTPRPTTGSSRPRPVLNGLHHVYERAA